MLLSIFGFSESEIIQETFVWLHNVPLNHMPHGLSMQHFFVISTICQISMITMVVPYMPHTLLSVPPLLSFLFSAPFPLSFPIPPPSTPPCCFFLSFCLLLRLLLSNLTWGAGTTNCCVRNPSHQPITHTYV